MNDSGVALMLVLAVVFGCILIAGMSMAILNSATEAAQQRVEQAIAEGRVLLGMSAGEVRRAWGEPDETANTTFRDYEDIKLPRLFASPLEKAIRPYDTITVPISRARSIWTYHNPLRTVMLEDGIVIEFSGW